jgi:hypothetical protein
MNEAFNGMVRTISGTTAEGHAEAIVENSRRNASQSVITTLRDIKPTIKSVVVISAGPSLYRNRSLELINDHRREICVVSIDGAYLQCLRAGIVPDFTLTLDPHPTRMVRWFGDPDLWENTAEDDYFARQDMDEAMRADMEKRNEQNIKLVDLYAARTPLVICSTAPANVVERTKHFPRYWFAPLVDNPAAPNSLTRQIAEITSLPSLNTGGTVGTAAVIFAQKVLRAPRIAVVGMDLGYALDLPYERTQTWDKIKALPNVSDYYPRVTHPLWGECYTDPSFWWYRQNLLALLKAGGFTLHNCTEHGTLYGPHVECLNLKEWLASSL